MSTITADPTLLLVLGQMTEKTEIRDANGNIVGVYAPQTLTVEEVRKMFDLDKIQERLRSEKGKGRPFREVVAKLKRLDREAMKRKNRTRKTA